jgi:hypothetical protein
MGVAGLLAELEKRGLLLLQDKKLPNVVTLVTGQVVAGSWWAHPKAREIFRCLGKIGDSPDAVATKLIGGKVTFVHRRLWVALLAVATSRERWQVDGLSKEARSLLRRVDKAGTVAASGAAVKELESRLLVVAREEHTASGAHAMVAESWESWAKRVKSRTRLSPSEGRLRIEGATAGLGSSAATLPWIP